MINIDNLVSPGQRVQEDLTELTGLEMSELNGGYAATIASVTRNPGLAFAGGRFVLGKRVSPSLTEEQVSFGLARGLVETGVDFANAGGGGIYTGPVTAAKLG
jgi:hypothetical protein